MTLEELRAKYPDEIAQAEAAARAAVDHTEAVNAAVQAERERMQEIDEVASLLDPADVREAKYGETPKTLAQRLPLLRKRKKTMTRRRPRKRGWPMQGPRFLRCSARRRAKL